MQKFITTTTSGNLDLTDVSREEVGIVTVEFVGLTGSGASVIPETRMDRDVILPGSTIYGYVQYFSRDLATTYTAGTAITTDGIYQVPANGQVVALAVTGTITSQVTVNVRPLVGPGISGSASGGGGGGGGGAYVPVLRYGDTALTQLAPAGDTDPHSMFTVTSGKVADGATASGISPVLIGAVGADGNAHNGLASLISATPVSTATYGLTTYSVLAGVSSGNTIRSLVTATGFTAGGSAATSLVMVEARASNSAATTYEQVFNNLNVSVLTSAPRTTTQTSADQTNWNHRGIKVVLDVTAGSSLSLVFTLNNKDLNSGKYYNVFTGGTVTGVSTNVYTIYPGATAVANVTVNDIIARLFQTVITAGNATSATYTLSYSLIV